MHVFMNNARKIEIWPTYFIDSYSSRLAWRCYEFVVDILKLIYHLCFVNVAICALQKHYSYYTLCRSSQIMVAQVYCTTFNHNREWFPLSWTGLRFMYHRSYGISDQHTFESDIKLTRAWLELYNYIKDINKLNSLQNCDFKSSTLFLLSVWTWANFMCGVPYWCTSKYHNEVVPQGKTIVVGLVNVFNLNAEQ